MHRETLTDEELSVLSKPSQRKPIVSKDGTQRPAPSFAAECEVVTELHDAFAPVIADIFSRLGAVEVRCRRRNAERCTYGQFVFSQSIPTCCAVIRAEPTRLEFYAAVQPSILYPLIDAMFGVTMAEPPPQRPLTELEAVLAGRVMEELLRGYSQTLERALSLELSVDRLEHNAQQFKGLPGGEAVYVVTYDLQCRSDYGRLTLCLPWRAIGIMRERLTASP